MSEVAESANGTAVAESGSGSSNGAQSEQTRAERPSVERPQTGQTPRSAAQREADGQSSEAQEQQPKESRYERTKRERKEFFAQRDRDRAALQRERQELARERAEYEESKKPKRNYTLAQLKQYRNEWAQEAQQGVDGREELVYKADQAIREMEAEERASKVQVSLPRHGTPEHRKIWENSEAQIRQDDPDFGTPGTRIDTKLRELFASQNAQLYRDHPYGIFAAYSEAQKEILKEDNQVLRKEIATLKQENAQLQGLTSIGGGVPGRMGGGTDKRDFASLSAEEMRKRLMSRPAHSDRWL